MTWPFNVHANLVEVISLQTLPLNTKINSKQLLFKVLKNSKPVNMKCKTCVQNNELQNPKHTLATV